MRVIGFGDSFTAGEGTDNQYVEQLSTFEKIEKYQKEHSWPRYLADKIGVKYVNNGEVGSSNYRIFSNIFEQFAQNNINNDDLVVIMWSSPLRDPLPFFPHMFSRTSPIGLSWSMKELMSQDTQGWKHRYYEHYGKTEKSEIKYIENDKLMNFYGDENPDIPNTRRQDLTPPAYVRNGSIYAMTYEQMVGKGLRIGKDVRPYIMDEQNSINLDEPLDLEIAKIKIRSLIDE